jgi:hypothetical protein
MILEISCVGGMNRKERQSIQEGITILTTTGKGINYMGWSEKNMCQKMKEENMYLSVSTPCWSRMASWILTPLYIHVG